MSDTAYLILENGMVFEGKYFGAKKEVIGELVFTTSMTGYIETLTDPSYFGQIVLHTFPLIGNYGIIPDDFESANIACSAYIVKYPCQIPSNFRSEGSLDTFFNERNIIGLYDVDTRAIAKAIRKGGVMNGKITGIKPDNTDLTSVGAYKIKNSVSRVSTEEIMYYKAEHKKYTVAIMDYGLKDNIKRELLKRGCELYVFPYNSTYADLKAINPDGIILSNGPGNPSDNTELIHNIKEFIAAGLPIFGICLGHQLLALANGFSTQKLKYGHRGANHAVKNIWTGKVYIASQNHGYAVVSDSINTDIAEELFVNVNDSSCEGIAYKNSPAFSVQFHPEACSGPLDTSFLFDQFTDHMEVYKHAFK